MINQLSLTFAFVTLTLCGGLFLPATGENAGADEITRVAPNARPAWIWGTKDRIAGQRVTLSKPFQVRSAVARATMHLAADFTRCSVALNRRPLARLDEYAPWMQWDVTDRLVTGTNQLSLDCTGGDGPAAVATSLEIVYADGSIETVASGEDWKTHHGAAVSLGSVAGEFWNVSDLAKISPFEDYEQWRRASGADAGTDPATFVTQPGFEVDLIRSAKADEGSWVSMALDPQGRITIAREDKGLLRMTLSRDGKRITAVETINDELLECRGLLYAYDALYANANNSKGLYRLRDTDADDQFDQVELLREFPGSVGHGRNDLALGPDGWIYSIHGDSVELATENIDDRTSPLRAARNGQRSEEGHLIRTDRDGSHWERLASGLRNPFGIDFNDDGEAFTYDADNEYDMGAPWYRPTRMVQLVSGGDYGWRRKTNGQWPPYFPDHSDNALPTVDVGKGSPTAVKSGARSSFPAHYRRAVFALDWAYGRILACHLSPRGAGYACRVETFLAGRPLNVTDLDFSPDGDMLVITGGRKTQSALYRIRYVGPSQDADVPTEQQKQRQAYSSRSRSLRRQLAELHQPNRDDLATAWEQLGNPDPLIRNAARIAIEHQERARWRHAALSEPEPEIQATSLLALARAGDRNDHDSVLEGLDALKIDGLTSYGKLSILHAYRLILGDPATTDSVANTTSKQRLLRWLESQPVGTVAPLGSGSSVHEALCRLAADLHLAGVVPPLMELLRVGQSQRDRMNALFMLCHQPSGWSMEDRVLFFEALGELERTAFSGAGMPGRLKQIREHAVERLTEDERDALGALIEPATLDQDTPKQVSRPHVRKWALDELVAALDQLSTPGDEKRGEALFHEVLCASCHRVAGRGGVLGPDLSSLAARFASRDILASIISPSDVIAEKYRSVQIVTTDGKIVSGQVITGGDYRSSNLQLATDPLDPGKVVEIPKQDIQLHRPSKVSPMPEGLLDTLTASEIADLLAFLTGQR
ncbi:Cytochrome c [Stieleria neptunia]|uniref:Cytochrome c n=1 Tax=Stieleria neptunia TaxID=2527979 RepID=A0A518I3K9_9BACT|nr:c-type cytochrome [Stieleria neptunia]QDV47638.1 Cytochrome c [Stieleria neptunia]